MSVNSGACSFYNGARVKKQPCLLDHLQVWVSTLVQDRHVNLSLAVNCMAVEPRGFQPYSSSHPRD